MNGIVIEPAWLARTGPLKTDGLRLEDGFYRKDSGALDAPDYIAAGSVRDSDVFTSPDLYAMTTVMREPF